MISCYDVRLKRFSCGLGDCRQCIGGFLKRAVDSVDEEYSPREFLEMLRHKQMGVDIQFEQSGVSFLQSAPRLCFHNGCSGHI